MKGKRIPLTLGIHTTGEKYLDALRAKGISISSYTAAALLDPGFTAEQEPVNTEVVPVSIEELNISRKSGRIMEPIVRSAEAKGLRAGTMETALALLLRTDIPQIHALIGMESVTIHEYPGTKWFASVFYREPADGSGMCYRSINVVSENPEQEWYNTSFLFRVK